ncbi:MAG: phosphoribosylformylglycinamidine cyclo-ligase [Candidatus Helarchaeota archaeon]
MKDEEYTYEKAGVSVDKATQAHKLIGQLIERTCSFRDGKFGAVVGEYGHYAGLLDIGNNLRLALHVDGVGTKVLVAQLMAKYDTVGIDLIAMHANDLICMGAEPVALEDYLAVEEANPALIAEIVKGIVAGAELAQMAVIGGETATMPDVIKGAVKGKGFDLSAMSVGVVHKNHIITGKTITPSDIIIGLESSGIHSNGLTLARKALLELGGLSITQIGPDLLTPTKIYSREVLDILQQVEIHGLAHITGGAFSKLSRLSFGSIGFYLTDIPSPPTIFQKIQEISNLSDYEMYRKSVILSNSDGKDIKLV